MLMGLRYALDDLKRAGCKSLYLDGSFVTGKVSPGDYDCCWDTQGVTLESVDPVLLDTSFGGSLKQKVKFGGEFFPASLIEGGSGERFLDFFQTDKETGQRK